MLAKPFTIKDIEAVLDKKLDQKFEVYQGVILGAVDEKFLVIKKDQINLVREINLRFDDFEKRLDKLATTLDGFLKRLTDYDDEFAIMKAEMRQVKSVLKSKFGIEISLQNPPRAVRR